MPKVNQFKAFAAGDGANVLDQAAYEALTQLLAGFGPGRLPSAWLNKVLRQATFVSSALAEYIKNTLNLDVPDDGDFDGFVALLTSALGVGGGGGGSQPTWAAAITSIGAVVSTAAEHPVNNRALLAGALHPNDVIEGWMQIYIPDASDNGAKNLRLCVANDPSGSLLETLDAGTTGIVTVYTVLSINAAQPHVLDTQVFLNQSLWDRKRGYLNMDVAADALNLQGRVWLDDGSDSVTVDNIRYRLNRSGL